MPNGKGPLRIAIEDWLESFDISNFLWRGQKGIIEHLEDEALDYYESLYNRFDYKDVIPQLFKPATIRADRPKRPVQIVPILIGIGMMFVGLIIGTLQPAQRLGSYKVDKLLRSNRPTPEQIVLLLQRTDTPDPVLLDYMAEYGFKADDIVRLRSLGENFLSAFQYEQLYRRGKLTIIERNFELQRLGYSPTQINNISNIVEQIPGVSDITSMAVREAWNDQVSQRFGYDENPPPEFGEWLTRQGLSADWAKRYWRAHWQLPGIQQAFEMFQRLRSGQTANVFSESDLADYLRAADIPVYFRDRLKEIAYSPLTRVDIRRMYGVGTLTADQVYQAYRDIGYNDKNAKLLTDFTTRIEKAEEKGLTRAAMQDAYRRGLWSRNDTIKALQEIGYSPEDADFWLDIVDNDFFQQIQDAKLTAIQYQYENGYLDDSTVYTKLGPLNLPSDRQVAILELWTARKQSKINLPSRSELDDFIRRGIIDETQYRDYLKKSGYPNPEIELFVRRIDDLVSQDRQLELADLQAQQEATAKAGKASAYQKAIADLNVKIAENKSAIADIKLALHDITDADTIASYKAGIDYLKSQNAELDLEKAKARQLLIA